jgi:hypothetical protein
MPCRTIVTVWLKDDPEQNHGKTCAFEALDLACDAFLGMLRDDKLFAGQIQYQNAPGTPLLTWNRDENCRVPVPYAMWRDAFVAPHDNGYDVDKWSGKTMAHFILSVHMKYMAMVEGL